MATKHVATTLTQDGTAGQQIHRDDAGRFYLCHYQVTHNGMTDIFPRSESWTLSQVLRLARAEDNSRWYYPRG